MIRLYNLSLLVFGCCISLVVHSQDVAVSSPNGNTIATFTIDAQKNNAVFYSVKNKDKIILAESPLGLEFENQKALQTNLQILSVKRTAVNTSWKPVYGEKNKYPDHYNEVLIQLKEANAPGRKFAVTCRVYDEGVAFNYTIYTNKPLTISRELTGFQFDKDYTSWIAHRAQAEYKQGSISETGSGCERPYVIKMNNDRYVALGEAALVNNARMKFDRSQKDSLLLVAALDGKSTYSSSFSTPWRYIMIADSPGQLLENNYFILNLNSPNALKDVSWIKPGKVIRESTLTTKGAKACIDFAASHNLQYIEFDSGWYGAETDTASDATTVTVDPARSRGPLALQEVIDYGKTKHVGVILYVNQRALATQLDSILPLYQSWGVKGIKYGFVTVGSRQSTSWLHEAVRKAAKYKLLIDIHDEYRPTGYSRTYPNLLTQEGIRGDEESPFTEHTITTLFTRSIAGAADNTNCYFTARVDKMGSHVAQMAKAVCIYSPLQFLYWYDNPAPESPH
ncbi:MAG: glycoside hydrolase family 97 N-terminal domain-containing protein, partial [Ginsengibacter sp.]